MGIRDRSENAYTYVDPAVEHDSESETDDKLPLCFGEVCDHSSNFVCHTGFKQCSSDDKHRYEKNYIAVNKSLSLIHILWK